MSQLRKQLIKILPKLSGEANKLRDLEARSRWMLLKKITHSSKSLAQACAFYGWSEDSYHKWGLRLKKHPRISSLYSKTRKPYRSPKKTKPRIEKKVISLRRFDPSLGPDRISDELKRLYNLIVSQSTVYQVLIRAGLISRKLARRLTKRH